ncbi:unnamed protein product [Chrysodeixis includens]|uniref:HMG box domain-containing protein n=1 Tax=Chrysodeixis includens TaxID=689277 RepID=A0A9P0BPD4_CHRIL|nr:unnamed protein product [Chrysodeixis includens]
MMDKPKRPMSAYMLWLKSERVKIKADYPGLKMIEVVKKAGEIWRSMGDKSTWEEKAADAKEQYARELECYNGQNPSKATGKAKPAKATRNKKKKEPAHDGDDDSE